MHACMRPEEEVQPEKRTWDEVAAVVPVHENKGVGRHKGGQQRGNRLASAISLNDFMTGGCSME